MLRKTLFLGALLVAPYIPLHAQSFPTDDPIIKRIWALGMDSTHVYELSQALFDSVGPRLQGGDELRAGNDWLVSKYKSWGIEAHNEQYGTFR